MPAVSHNKEGTRHVQVCAPRGCSPTALRAPATVTGRRWTTARCHAGAARSTSARRDKFCRGRSTALARCAPPSARGLLQNLKQPSSLVRRASRPALPRPRTIDIRCAGSSHERLRASRSHAIRAPPAAASTLGIGGAGVGEGAPRRGRACDGTVARLVSRRGGARQPRSGVTDKRLGMHRHARGGAESRDVPGWRAGESKSRKRAGQRRRRRGPRRQPQREPESERDERRARVCPSAGAGAIIARLAPERHPLCA